MMSLIRELSNSVAIIILSVEYRNTGISPVLPLDLGFHNLNTTAPFQDHYRVMMYIIWL